MANFRVIPGSHIYNTMDIPKDRQPDGWIDVLCPAGAACSSTAGSGIARRPTTRPLPGKPSSTVTATGDSDPVMTSRLSTCGTSAILSVVSFSAPRPRVHTAIRPQKTKTFPSGAGSAIILVKARFPPSATVLSAIDLGLTWGCRQRCSA